MKVHKGGTVVYNYRRDGMVQVYRERWYHKIRSVVFGLLYWTGLWK